MGAPGNSDRTVVLGRTGSGKTQFACDLLSYQSWDLRPWIVIDFKGEKLIAEIGKVMGPRYYKKMDVTAKVPDKPGLYHVRCLPDQREELEALMVRIWEHEDCGFYVDEGYMLPQRFPRDRGYTYLLTQGRSKEIPMIMLYQRPLWLNVFVKEQADFFAVFQLNGEKDAQAVMEYIKPVRTISGGEITPNHGLSKYHCIWYDVSEGRSSVLRPARSRQKIIQAFSERAGRGGKPDRALIL